MSITVGELRELLEDFDERLTVRLMVQQSYPFEHAIHGVISSNDIKPENFKPFERKGSDNKEVVYIIEGIQLSYGYKGAWDLA
jgi:hypothetical protein